MSSIDNADTGRGGFFKRVNLTDPARAAQLLKVGTRMKTVYAEHRTGSIFGFWFEPAD